MSATRGFVAGVAGLALLEAIVSSDQAAGRVGGVFDTTAKVLARWLDPYTPLVPNLTGSEVSPFGGSSSGTVTSSIAASPFATPRRLPATPQAPNAS